MLTNADREHSGLTLGKNSPVSSAPLLHLDGHLCDAVMPRPKLGMAPNTNEAQQEKLRQLESRLRQTGAAQACGEARGEAVKINRCLRCLHDGIYMDLIWLIMKISVSAIATTPIPSS